jgi:hypothetical protein
MAKQKVDAPSETQVESSTEQVAKVEETGIVEVEIRTESHHEPPVNKNDVKFEVSYGNDFKGKKTMSEGIHIMSKETAEILISRGYGKIVK